MPSENRRLSARLAIAAALVVNTFALLLPAETQAAGLAQAMIRLDRMKTSTPTGGLICAAATTASVEAKVLVTFPSGYTVNTTAANWTVTTTNLPTGATAWPGIGTASNVTGQVVTFPSTDLAVSTRYCFNFSATTTLTTSATAAPSQQASLETRDSGNVQIDYGQVALANIADDQIVVTAVVPPSFIFTLNGNTDVFTGNLDPSGIVSTTGRTVTVTTNAKGGWIAWVKDSNQGLRSPTANYTIPSTGVVGDGLAETLVAGTEGYLLDTDLTTDAAGGCTLVIDPDYNGSTIAKGGRLAATFQPIASCTTPTPATANGDVITLIERAAISGATPAGSDYSDILTVVGAGNF